MMLHFYWQSEDGSQQGPSDVAELKRAWKSKQLHKDCHVYAQFLNYCIVVSFLGD